MTTQTLFRSLNAQAVDNVEPIHSRKAHNPRWALFQSINAKAWDPIPALTVDEKLKRRVAVPSQTNLFDSSPKIRLPKVSNQLAQGLRNMGSSENTSPSQAEKSSPQLAQNTEVHVDVFRLRSSRLFEQTNDDAKPRIDDAKPRIDPHRLDPLPHAESLLVNIFERLTLAKSRAAPPDYRTRQSLRSTLSALSRQKRDSY